MFQATVDKHTRITGEGEDFGQAVECLRAASNGRHHVFGNVATATLNKAEQGKLAAALATLRQEAKPEPLQPVQERPASRFRIMRHANSPVGPRHEIVTSDGEVLRFTGCGRTFICRDELEEPEFHGMVVQWAYYA